MSLFYKLSTFAWLVHEGRSIRFYVRSMNLDNFRTMSSADYNISLIFLF